MIYGRFGADNDELAFIIVRQRRVTQTLPG